MKTRIFTLIMSLFVATMAFAYDAEIDGIYYNLDAENKIAEVTSGDYYYCYSGNIIIPEKVTYNGVEYGVTSIGGGAFSRSFLTSITIPNSVTSIGSSAFSSCSSLTSIDVDENNLNYASIDGVLYNKEITTLIGCPGGKTSITIPNSVTSIGSSVFYGCSFLTSINVETNNQNYASIDGVLYNKEITALICCPDGKTSITIPNSVTSIGDYAFSDCSSLTSITIPNSVTSIGGYAFSYCSSLTSVTIGNSVTSIGDYAFSYCSSLTSITIQAENPPVLLEEGYYGSHVFQSVSRSISIKVPCGSKAKYQTAYYWKEFINYEEVPAGTLTVDVNDKTMGFATITKQNNCTDDVAQVQAQALAGYEFVRWSDGATENPHILLVTEDMTITAEFRKIGEEPEDKPGEDETHNNFIVESADKTQGTVEITITAKAIEGFEFDHWSDGSTENPRVVTLDEDVELYAYFRVAGTGLENSVISSANVYGNNGVLYVEGAETDYYVLDAAGRLIYTGRNAQLQLSHGVYVIAIGGEVQKVVL